MAAAARPYHCRDLDSSTAIIDAQAIIATSRFGFAARGNDLAAAISGR
jgi:hypothetical protein